MTYNNLDLWDYTNFCQAMMICSMCCVECTPTQRTRCIMYDIAKDMLIRGEY